MRLALLLAVLVQGEPGFRKDDRVVAAVYVPGETPRRELAQMGQAGIDLALVRPGAFAKLAAAVDELDRQKSPAPRLGLYLEADLGTAEVRDALAAAVPLSSRAWALAEGRRVVWLPPAGAARYDRASFQAFVEKLRPAFVVAETSWKDVAAERVYTRGPVPQDDPVVWVSAAGDDAAYERAWYRALKLEPRWIAIDDWGSAANRLEATARYVKKFRLNEKIALPKGKWAGTDKVFFTLRTSPREQGLVPVANDDGLFGIVEAGAISMLTTKENAKGAARHLYFDVDDSYWFFEKRSFEVLFEYLDAGQGSFSLEYDSFDRSLKGAARAHKPAGEKKFGGTGQWKTESFHLPDAAFGNGQAGGADFRFVVDKRGLALRRVAVLPK